MTPWSLRIEETPQRKDEETWKEDKSRKHGKKDDHGVGSGCFSTSFKKLHPSSVPESDT